MNQQHSVRKVVQTRCSSNLTRAAGEFGQIAPNGAIPIVLCPRRRKFGLFITIPTGVTAILASSGADKGEVPPGTHFAPPWVNCVYMVPNQACTYNYDVVACPTQDNVMVQVDITLVFRITNARQFCFTLGAQKFDDMLKAVCEEAIRTKVRGVNHKVVYELRGSASDELLTVMNKAFGNFGVIFVNSTITNVLLPKDVASALERITQLNQKIKEHKKSHEFEVKRLNDEHDLSLQELTLQNERMIAELEAEKQRLVIDMETKKSEMEKQKELAIIKAHEERTVGLKAVNALLVNEKINAETRKEQIVQEAQAAANKRILEAEHWSENKIIQSEAELIEAQNRAKVLLLEGEAEAVASDCMKEAREFDLKQRATAAFQKLASKGKIIINGKDGGSIVSELVGNSSDFVRRIQQ